MVRVLPVPAPASTQTGPRGASTASRCSSSSPSVIGSATIGMASILAAVADKPGAAPHPNCPAFQRCATRNASSPGYVGRVMTHAPLTVYTTSWCGFCHRLMTVLESNKIPFDVVDIEQDPAAAAFVGSVNGGNKT